MSTFLSFPPGFVWGATTAAYQIEGAWNIDGRGESIWDRFTHTPGKIRDGSNGDIACDHYNRYPEDVEHMARLGLKAYRFSIAWPRIFPSGKGPLNQKGLDFYRRLVEALLQHNIQPMATLYHWDLPQALEDRGGWINRDTALYFAEYADTMFRHLGPQIPYWITHNEPFFQTFFGYGNGENAPGKRKIFDVLTAGHHILLSHGMAVEAFRAAGLHASTPGQPDPQIGIALVIYPAYPASDRLPDVLAARRMDGIIHRCFFDPLFRGSYPEDILRHFGRRLIRPAVCPGDMDLIAQPMDFVGINTYTRIFHRADWRDLLTGARQLPPREPITAMENEVYPGCIGESLQMARDYTDLPIYITESGVAFDDIIGPDGSIDDEKRVEYLRSHIAAAHAAIQAGIDLRGYFVWSLMDNFEWARGKSIRFGLIHVDYASQKRTWKRSAHFYRDVIARNGVEVEA